MLSPVGKNPVKKAVVVSLPTIESAFVTHTTKGIQGWSHPEFPVLRVAIEVLNATESYLWVSVVYVCDQLTELTSDVEVHPWFWIGLWSALLARRRGRLHQLHSL